MPVQTLRLVLFRQSTCHISQMLMSKCSHAVGATEVDQDDSFLCQKSPLKSALPPNVAFSLSR